MRNPFARPWIRDWVRRADPTMLREAEQWLEAWAYCDIELPELVERLTAIERWRHEQEEKQQR